MTNNEEIKKAKRRVKNILIPSLTIAAIITITNVLSHNYIMGYVGGFLSAAVLDICEIYLWNNN